MGGRVTGIADVLASFQRVHDQVHRAAADALQEAAASGGATSLKYPIPDGRPAVGLMALRDGWLASVRPVFYHASPLGGPQGVWRLDRLTLA